MFTDSLSILFWAWGHVACSTWRYVYNINIFSPWFPRQRPRVFHMDSTSFIHVDVSWHVPRGGMFTISTYFHRGFHVTEHMYSTWIPRCCACWVRNLYFSIIHPYFSNGLHVWGNTNITYLQQAIKLQKKAIRVINNSHPKEHTIPLFKKYNILPLTSQYELNTALFMFKIHHGQHPKAILVLFNRRFNESTHTTRQQQHFVVPKARCKIYEKSIFVQGPKKFNKLVNFFNLNCAIHTNKKLLSHYFLNSLE